MIAIRPAGGRVRVTFNGEVIAESRDALVLEEGKYQPVYYLPRKDVKMERLSRTTHRTHCPFKGEASYWSVDVGGTVYEDVAWSYEDPIPEADQIAGLLCFYPQRVEMTIGEDRAAAP